MNDNIIENLTDQEKVMLDVMEMTDQQKSVLLARAMGWEVFTTSGITGFLPPEGAPEYDDMIISYVSFYDPANMALAWRVLNWAFTENDELLAKMGKAIFPTLSTGPMGNEQYDDSGLIGIFVMPPADAQRLWLDKILSLALEARLVEVEDE